MSKVVNQKTIWAASGLLAVAVAVAGCGGTNAYAHRSGLPRAARAADCEVRFVDGAQNLVRYQPVDRVGSVDVYVDRNVGPLDPVTRKLLRPKACELGGELVVLSGTGEQYKDVSTWGGKWRIYSFSVFAAARSTDESQPL